MGSINRILRRFGVALVPAPSSAKMLREHANTCESQHLANGVHHSADGCVRWMRAVAGVVR